MVVSKTAHTDSNSHAAADPIEFASQSKGAATNEAAPCPTVPQTSATTGTSHTLIWCPDLL